MIIKALKNVNYDLRLTNDNKWLVWDYFHSDWVVYQLKMYAKIAREKYRGKFEEEAIKELLK